MSARAACARPALLSLSPCTSASNAWHSRGRSCRAVSIRPLHCCRCSPEHGARRPCEPRECCERAPPPAGLGLTLHRLATVASLLPTVLAARAGPRGVALFASPHSPVFIPSLGPVRAAVSRREGSEELRASDVEPRCRRPDAPRRVTSGARHSSKRATTEEVGQLSKTPSEDWAQAELGSRRRVQGRVLRGAGRSPLNNAGPHCWAAPPPFEGFSAQRGDVLCTVTVRPSPIATTAARTHFS